MALQKQVLELGFGAGVQERAQPEVMDPQAGALVLQNVVETKRGAWSKRPGFLANVVGTALDGTVLGTACRGGALRGGVGAWVSDGHYLYDYSGAASTNAWVKKDRLPECVARRFPAPGAPAGRLTAGYQAVFVNGFHVVTQAVTNAVANTTHIYATVIDATTGALVLGPTNVTDTNGGYGGPSTTAQYEHRVVQAGNNAWIIYCDINGLGAGSLVGVKLDTTAITSGWGARVTLLGAAGTNSPTAQGNFSATGSTSNGFCIMFVDTSAGSAPTISRRDATTGASLGAVQPFVGSFTYPVDLGGMDSSVLWCVAIDTASNLTVQAVGLSPSGLTTTSASTAVYVSGGAIVSSLGVAAITNSTACVLASTGPFGGSTASALRTVSIAAGSPITVTIASEYANVRGASAPFVVGGRVYAFVCPQSANGNGTAYLQVIDVSAATLPPAGLFTTKTVARPVANIAPGLIAVNAANNPLQATPVSCAGRTLSMPGNGKVYGLAPIARNASAASLDLVELSFVDTNRWQPVDMGAGSFALSGGCGTIYDGQAAFEMGFVNPPTLTSVTNSAGGLTGTFVYIAIYEFIDADGNVHWSEPSAPVSSGAIVSKVLTITATTPGITSKSLWKNQVVNVVFFRTTNGGNTYFRLDQTPATTSNTVSIVDALVDAALITSPQLYTQPGTPGTPLPRRSPPSLLCLIQHNDGLCGVADDGQTIWFSGQRLAGEGWWWSPLMIAVVEDPNPVVALASFEGRLYAFTRRNIWVIDGQGFSDNGLGGYSPPQLLPTDCGCIEPRSLVVTTEGCYFQSDRGIMLLNRSSAVSWVGEPVASTLTTYPVVTSACVDHTGHLLLFALATADAGAGAVGPGRIAVFDYASGQWSVWDVTDNGTNPHAPMQALWMNAGTLWALGNDGTGYAAAPGYCRDFLAWVPMQVELPWIKTGGLQGFQRAWRLLLSFISNSPHDLLIEFAFDDGPYTESASFTATTIAAMSPTEAWHHFKRQKCRKFKVRITDAPPTGLSVGTGQGPTLLGLRAIYGTKAKTPMVQGSRG